MRRLNQLAPRFAGAAWALFAVSAGCSSTPLPPNGVCALDATLKCDAAAFLGGPPGAPGLLGYSCTGTRRPDADARYTDGVPQGTLCASRGASGDGRQSYCCTPTVTSCAYNPVAICDSGDGYQCRGSNRPEALNPAIQCGNGVEQGEYLNYCCSGQKAAPECTQTDTIGCSEKLTGFTCPGSSLPKGEQLGSSQSRADYYRLLCPTPTPSNNVKYNNYCCYMPALVPKGASCVQDTAVPGCTAGRFGFACYGTDTPDQDYGPMHCPNRGTPGTSAEGYPATLYCCDFQ